MDIFGNNFHIIQTSQLLTRDEKHGTQLSRPATGHGQPLPGPSGSTPPPPQQHAICTRPRPTLPAWVPGLVWCGTFDFSASPWANGGGFYHYSLCGRGRLRAGPLPHEPHACAAWLLKNRHTPHHAGTECNKPFHSAGLATTLLGRQVHTQEESVHFCSRPHRAALRLTLITRVSLHSAPRALKEWLPCSCSAVPSDGVI